MLSERPKYFYVYITASRPRGVLDVGMTSNLAASAQRREYLMKRWRRDWKIELIERGNPTWRDLFDDAVRLEGLEP